MAFRTSSCRAVLVGRRHTDVDGNLPAAASAEGLGRGVAGYLHVHVDRARESTTRAEDNGSNDPVIYLGCAAPDEARQMT